MTSTAHPVTAEAAAPCAAKEQGCFSLCPAAQTDFNPVMAAYWSEWGAREDRTQAVAGFWTARIFEKATFGHLAWQGNELIGLIFGHVTGSCGIPLSGWRQSSSWAEEAEAEDPNALTLLNTVEAANEILRKAAAERGSVYSAELDFLWVSPSARGLGLSGILLEAAHDSMSMQGAHAYTLFTDSFCNVAFYQRDPWIPEGRLSWNALTRLRKASFPADAESFMFGRKI